MVEYWTLTIQYSRMNITRTSLMSRLSKGLKDAPVVALLGPRQCGKTTLARELVQRQHGTYFDLENPRDEARLREPLLALEACTGLVVLDEIQRQPNILPLLRVLADRHPIRARTGSFSRFSGHSSFSIESWNDRMRPSTDGLGSNVPMLVFSR